MRRALLMSFALAAFSTEGVQAEEFSVGGFVLSGVIDETLKTGGEAWDAEANHRKWTVTKNADEPVLRYSIFVATGKLGEPHAEHHVSVYATDRRQAFLMDFDNALDAADDTLTRDFLKTCAKDVATLGGATISIQYASPLNGLPYSFSIIVDRDMEPVARAQTLEAIRGKGAGSLSTYDLTRSLNFKRLAATLGPDFRGAIVNCGFSLSMEPTAIWETRFLDLPLAATVFNLDPQ